MLLDSPTKRNLLPIFGTSRRSQLQFCDIRLDGDNLCTSGGRTNVDHEDFILGKFGNLGLLAVRSLDTEKTAKKEVIDFEIAVD